MLNKRGAALLQVLIISAVLAGISAMVLRATLSRTLTARQTRHTISTQMIIENAMAQINARWASLDPETYAAYLDECILRCPDGINALDSCLDDIDEYSTDVVQVPNAQDPAHPYRVEVKFDKDDDTGKCIATYSIANGVNVL